MPPSDLPAIARLPPIPNQGGSRGGVGSSMRRGSGYDSSFRSSSSGRDYGHSSGGGGNRYESSRNSNHVARRSPPVHHSPHHNNNHHHTSRPSPNTSSYRPRDNSGGRMRRDSDTLSGGGPPKRIVSSIRGRGRVLTSGATLGRGRGGFRPIRGRVGRPDGLRTMGTLRKRILATSSVRSREFVRLKTSKIRSLALRKRSRTLKESDDEEEDDEDQEEDTEIAADDDEEIAQEEEPAEGEEGEKTNDEEGQGDKAQGGSTVAEKKKTVVAKKVVSGESDEKAGDAKEAASDSKNTETVEKSDSKKESAGDEQEVDDSEGKKKEKATTESPSPVKKGAKDVVKGPAGKSKKTFIKLVCPHCPKQFIRTFREYISHLYSDGHRLTLQRVSLKLKHQLLKMRTAQRAAQREADQEEDSETARTTFCVVCRLNHRQTSAQHNASDGHINMVKFQRPKCSICRIYFKAPLAYEEHRCSLEHIQNKARSENLRTDDENSDGEVERVLENFTTVDSVGDVDDEDAGDLPPNSITAGKEDIEDEDINIGVEHVNKIEVYFCDLCRYYMPQKGNMEERLKLHCQSRSHLRAYLRFKDEELLRQDAERLAKKKKAAAAKKAAAKAEEDKSKAPADETSTAKEEVVVNGEDAAKKASGKDEEAKAEKDLTANGKDDSHEDGDELELTATDEIPQDEDPDMVDLMDRSNFEDDDDSRINSERYDRFRYSGDKSNGAEDEEVETKGTKAKEATA